jgi:PPP family 3-phenylpropionic acid transporter
VDISFLTAVLFILLNGALMCMMPILNSLAFAFEDYGIQLNYGLARGIGSAAYAITSLIMGFVVAHISPKLLPILYVAILAGLIPQINGFRVRGKKRIRRSAPANQPTISTVEFLKKHVVFMIFLGGFLLVYLDHMMINNFFIYFIDNVGGTTSDMGIAVFLAAILELVSMTALERIKNKVNTPSLLIFSGVMFTVKHIITWLAKSMFMIYVAQFFQMFAYAIFIPASVYYVNQIFDKEDSVKGQALVTMSMTAAGVFASLLGGFMIDAVGPSMTLLIGAIVSAIGTGVMIYALRPQQK